MTIQLHIFKEDKLVFATEKSTALLDGGRTYIIEFDEAWLPEVSGNYNVTIILSTSNKELNFDIQEKIVTVTGSDLAGEIIQGVDDFLNINNANNNTTEQPYDAVIEQTQDTKIDFSKNNLQDIAMAGLAFIIIAGILIVLVKKKK